MRCPACNEIGKDKVIDSRLTESGGAIRRRRVCQACNRRFTTKERAEEELRIAVIKKDGSRVRFRRDKIVTGIQHACYKLPIDDASIEAMTDDIEGELFRDHDREVTSRAVGECVARKLRDVNHVAYVRFMSVFREFNHVSEFAEEIQRVEDHAATASPDQQSLFDD